VAGSAALNARKSVLRFDEHRIHLRPGLTAILLFCLLAFTCQAAWAAGPKRVMLLHSFGRDFAPWGDYARTIRAELSRQFVWPLDIIDHSLVTARFGGEVNDRPFIDYLNTAYAGNPLDLIITIGSPAAQFVQQHRQQFFPATPLVIAAVEQRRVRYSDMTENDVAVAVHSNFNAVFENMLRVLPETRTVAVVAGNSPLEKFWLEEIREESKRFESQVAFTWYNDLSFEEILKRAAALPPRSAIFWQMMNIDAAGVAYEGNAAFGRLHAVANAPMFSTQGVFFGLGIVGGPMHSVLEASQQTAAVAVRLLAGEKATDLKLATVEFARPKFDWRELQRWGIPESRLPTGSEISFRDPTVWEQYRVQILGVSIALLIQAALISWLVYEHRRRHLAEVQSRISMAELAYMDRIATAGELSASLAHEINQPLTGITTRASAALRWLAPEKRDLEKVRTALIQIVAAGDRAGDIVSGVRAMFKKEPGGLSRVDINELIRVVLEIVRVELQKNGVVLELQLGDVSSIEADHVQLQQVVINLIMNGIDAMNSVQPRRLRIRTEMSGMHTVHASFEDTGTGIDPANLDRIFKALFTTKARGMGMGLSICRSIIESHGGRIWVSPGAETGTIFHFELPAATP
jgi:signal transduction histidine kinase